MELKVSASQQVLAERGCMLSQAGGPFGGLAEVGEFGGDIGANRRLERYDCVEDPDGVFTHLGAGEELRGPLGEIEAELNGVGGNGDPDIVIAE